jgi:hypothetical protein
VSKTKAKHLCGRVVWVLANSHDIVLARMVEAAPAIFRDSLPRGSMIGE